MLSIYRRSDISVILFLVVMLMLLIRNFLNLLCLAGIRVLLSVLTRAYQVCPCFLFARKNLELTNLNS